MLNLCYKLKEIKGINNFDITKVIIYFTDVFIKIFRFITFFYFLQYY